jgi:uncharacterized protein HemY
MMNLVLGAIAVAIIVLIVVYARDFHSSSSQRQRASGRSPRASHHLKTKLLKLMHGDRQGAERLIQQAKLKYGGKSENWYFEKVIFDLERDRWR